MHNITEASRKALPKRNTDQGSLQLLPVSWTNERAHDVSCPSDGEQGSRKKDTTDYHLSTKPFGSQLAQQTSIDCSKFERMTTSTTTAATILGPSLQSKILQFSLQDRFPMFSLFAPSVQRPIDPVDVAAVVLEWKGVFLSELIEGTFSSLSRRQSSRRTETIRLGSGDALRRYCRAPRSKQPPTIDGPELTILLFFAPVSPPS